MIECKNLCKTFGGKYGIHNINIQFSNGLLYGLIGNNGSGKTTLLRCIGGLYLPTTGHVFNNGISTKQEHEFLDNRRKTSYLPSDDFLYKKLTCMENIELATILRIGKRNLTDDTLRLIEYFEVKDYLNKRFCDCSTGMRKKIQIIVSLIGEIDTIIWDEPNDGLDIVSNLKIKYLLNYYKKKNATIILSCHVIEFLNDFIDNCIFLLDGEIKEQIETKNVESLDELFLKHIDKKKLFYPFI
ncbi:MAG: ABC transporter ATP-binding protein [Treponema sp.]|nr:ABC transporter ATP-binding protein [Treponema sp.]